MDQIESIDFYYMYRSNESNSNASSFKSKDSSKLKRIKYKLIHLNQFESLDSYSIYPSNESNRIT